MLGRHGTLAELVFACLGAGTDGLGEDFGGRARPLRSEPRFVNTWESRRRSERLRRNLAGRSTSPRCHPRCEAPRRAITVCASRLLALGFGRGSPANTTWFG